MKLHRFLEDYAFTISLNANDTFGWGCADIQDIEIDELPGIIELNELFGCDGVNAFMATKRDTDVMNHSSLRTEKYYQAKQYINDNFLTNRDCCIPKKYVCKESYNDKGFIIFEKDNQLDYCENPLEEDKK